MLTEFSCFGCKHSIVVVAKITPIGILQAFFGLITCNQGTAIAFNIFFISLHTRSLNTKMEGIKLFSSILIF